jgi:predicted ATP-grasp superfamily ATP-dependent carboligase
MAGTMSAPAPQTDDRSGYVYVLKAHKPFEECYKIGRTNKPARRFSEFAVKLPYKVETVCVWREDDCHDVESELHNIFAAKRLDGEWFKLDAKDVDWLLRAVKFFEAKALIERISALIVTTATPGVVVDFAKLNRLSAVLNKAISRYQRRHTTLVG